VEKAACNFREQCHIKCPKKRFVGSTPIVPGEVGTGPYGLCNTLPLALELTNSAIVYGHGLFTTGKENFSDAFQTMLEVENLCRSNYFEKIDTYS
ncbi:MAG: rRNA adenine dimethylase, partial [Desulfobacula sp.]|nr:rRNA adenine dimethylase [Desulfobacula sp.]